MAGQGRTLLVLGGVLALGIGAAIWAMMSSPVEEDSGDQAAVSDVASAPSDGSGKHAASGARRASRAGSASVVGEVRRSKGKAPVAEQEVELLAGKGPLATVKTDAHGAFSFLEVPQGGPYELRVTAAGCGTVRIPGIALDRNERRDVGTLWLDPAVRVTVEVKAWSAEPVEGAVVEAFVVAQAENFDWSKAYAQMGQAPVAVTKASTDAAGVAVFPELASGRWTFVASKEGFARSGRGSVSVRPDLPPAPVKLFLGRGHPLAGKVTDAAKTPVPGALVLAGTGNQWDLGSAPMRARTTTDAEGRYAFAALDAGDAVLMVARPNGGIPSTVATVRIPNVSEFNVVLKGTATVTGTVTEKDGGKPIEAATVRAWNWAAGGANVSEATTDAQGKFAVTVTEGMVGSLQAEKAGWVSAEDVTRQRAPLQVREGETQTRDIQLRPGATVTGVVQGPEGPLAGAKVWVHSGSQNVGFTQKMATSDADGKYTVEAVPPGTAFVRADLSGYYVKDLPENYWMVLQQPGASPFKVEVAEGGTAVKDVSMARGMSVDGRVEGPDGPLAGVRVSSPQDYEGGMLTGADGTFRLEGVKPSPNTSLYTILDGYAPAATNKPFAVTPDQPVTGIVLRLVRVGLVRGTVTVADGSPLKDARVQVMPVQEQPTDGMQFYRGIVPGSFGGMAGAAAPVRADGTFEVPLGGIAAGKFRVNLTALERPAAQSEPVAIVDGQNEYTANISVDGGRDLEGRVVVKQGGAPVPGALVSIQARRNRSQMMGGFQTVDSGGGPTVWAVTDADGRFAVAHLAPSTYGVTSTSPGYIGGDATVDLATATNVTVELEPELTIEGLVMLGNGSLVEGALVNATRDTGAAQTTTGADGMNYSMGGSNASTTTGLGGRFRLTGLSAGNYKLRVTPDWQGEVNIKSKTTDPIAAGATGVKVVVDSGGVISGRVLDPNKKGVPNCNVSANPEMQNGKRPEGAENRNARTRDDGTFSIAGLSENATYGVTVQATQDWGPFAGSTLKNATLTGIAVGAKDLQFVLEEGLSITGTVVDGDGKPVANAALSCQVMNPDGKGSRQNRSAMTGPSGAFTLGGLESGECEITLQEWGGGGQGLVIQNGSKIVAGSRDVQLVATKGLTITGSVVDESGGPLRNARVNAMPAAGGRSRGANTKEDGSFEVTGLAPGASYRLLVTAQGRPFAKLDDVSAGANGVRVALARGLEAAGRLTDTDGSPLRQATLMVHLSNDPEQRQQAQTDENGNFKLTGLLDGVYEATCFVRGTRGNTTRKCGTLKAGDTAAALQAAEAK